MGIEKDLKGTVMKDPCKGGLPVFRNERLRRHLNINFPWQNFKGESNDWIGFDRETDYEGLACTIGDKVVAGENLRFIVEEKLFDNALDEKFLEGLFQDDITEKYCKGKLPTNIDTFVFMIMSCPIIEDDEDL